MSRRSTVRAPHPDELTFQDALKIHLGSQPEFRWWRQNSGVVPIRNLAGKIERYFHAGPPKGAADLSGITIPDGLRLEVELKSPTGTRSAEQIRWAEFITMSGGVYVLVAYNAGLSMRENCIAASRTILAAIDARRAR